MENIVTKEHMEALKALSDVNIKISEARNLLFTLQEQETEYLVEREKKALVKIEKVVENSKEMVEEANNNYAQIKELLVEVSGFAHQLTLIQENFTDLLAEFEQRNTEWNKDIKKQQDEITETRKLIKIEAQQIENDRQGIEQARKKLVNDQRKITSERDTLQRAVERLKQQRI